MTDQRFTGLRHRLYIRLLQPRSTTPDSRRREFILNILVSGLTLLAGVALLSSAANQLSGNRLQDSNSLVVLIVFFGITVLIWTASRRGHYQVGSYALLTLLLLVAVNLTLQWSFELPSAQLLYALAIVVAGILLNTRVSLWMTFVSSFFILVIGYLQAFGYLRPRTDWIYSHLDMSDAVGFVAILVLIGVVSWLSNREIDRSLRRARRSEAELAKERDSLEVKVVERTQALEELQLVRVMELQRFAEFGRLSAGLLHEVANPLTAASLNLEQLKLQQSSALIPQVQRNLQQLERYVKAARKQLQGESKVVTFSVRSEVAQVIKLLTPKAKKANVTLIVEQRGSYKLRGDPVKFDQLLANLIGNAVDAYEQSANTQRRVIVMVNQEDDLEITVSDWGYGIASNTISHLFDPFFSTKTARKRGLGIGLALVKQFVEDDFGGTVSVHSSAADGTHFMVHLTSQEKGL